MKKLSKGLNPAIDKQVCRMYKDGMTMPEIGEAFGGKSRQWVRNRLLHYGVPIRHNHFGQVRGENHDYDEMILKLWKQGLNLREIKEWGIPLCTTTIRQRLLYQGVRITGKRQPQRIDPEEVQEMAFLYTRMKMDMNQIARHYGYKAQHSVKERLKIAGVKIRSRSEVNKLNYAKGKHPACRWENGMRHQRKKTDE